MWPWKNPSLGKTSPREILLEHLSSKKLIYNNIYFNIKWLYQIPCFLCPPPFSFPPWILCSPRFLCSTDSIDCTKLYGLYGFLYEKISSYRKSCLEFFLEICATAVPYGVYETILLNINKFIGKCSQLLGIRALLRKTFLLGIHAHMRKIAASSLSANNSVKCSLLEMLSFKLVLHTTLGSLL